MVLGVLSYPGVAVVDIHSGHILVSKARKYHKPLGQKVGLEAIAWTYVCQIYHYLIGLCVVGFESEEDVIDEQISIYLACFESREKR